MRSKIVSADFLSNPYPRYHALRSMAPLHWSEEFCGGGWLLTGYADVAAVLRDPRFSAQRVGGWVNGSGAQSRAELRELKAILARSLVFLNGGMHTRLRQVMNVYFKPALIQSMRPRIQCLVDGLLDQMTAGGDIDFMRDFARPLPALVIAEMLGVDSCDQARFIAWSSDIAAFIGSPTPTLDIARRAQTSLVAMTDYFRALLPQRRLHPGADLVSQLILAEQEGGIITTKELLAQCSTLLFAGHETTRNFLGNGLLALLEHPRQWAMLRDSPSLMASALKELLRFDSPVQYTGRKVLADVEMHGQWLRRGSLVIPLIGAANRDPAKFSDPDTLDLTRNEGNHLSFGFGPHVCIGATLSYAEAEVAFTTLIRRLPDLALLPGARWGSNAAYRGLATLPVRASPARIAMHA